MPLEIAAPVPALTDFAIAAIIRVDSSENGAARQTYFVRRWRRLRQIDPDREGGFSIARVAAYCACRARARWHKRGRTNSSRPTVQQAIRRDGSRNGAPAI